MKKKYTHLPCVAGNYLQPPQNKNRAINKPSLLDRIERSALAAVLFMLAAVPALAQEAYCIPETPYADGQGITNVSIGNINNNTGLEDPGNYGDYTAQAVNIGQGATYPISISLATFTSYSVKVWIDWNNNFTFENNEQVITAITEEAAAYTVRGTITVPATAILGSHRMRIAARVSNAGLAQPCYSGFDAAAYEDYTVNVTVAPTCFIPGTPTVANTGYGAINVNWAAPAAGAATGYEYAIGTTNTPPASGTPVTGTSLTNLTVPGDVTGYIFVRTNCGNGNYSEWVTGTFYNGVCVPALDLVNGSGITNVTIGSINNETEDEDGHYGNYTAQSVNIGQGVTQPFSITFTTGPAYTVALWADWNNDLDFDDEGEKIYDGTASGRATDPLRGTFTVPATAALGPHRLRIGGGLTFGAEITPCNQTIGSFEDYTINVTAPPACFTPLSPTGVTVAAGIANLSWTAPALGGTPTGYEYAVTATATPPASGTPNPTTAVTGVTVTTNAVNYIHVRTNCGAQGYSEWMTALYYNGYCIPQLEDTDGNGIINVTIGAINNTTEREEGQYGDFTAQAVSIGQGDTKQFSIGFNTLDNPYNTKIWADWNDDLDFDDEGEELYTGISAAAPSTILRGYITVPLSATLGSHRMRIGSRPQNSGENPEPCTIASYGMFEDYTINVSTAPSCYTPRNLTAVNERSGFATVSWEAPALGGTPAGYEYAVTTTNVPAASGTAATATTLTGIAVTPGVVNYLHVRTNCGSGGFSEWVTTELYNGVCIPSPETVDNTGITNVTIGTINNSTNDEETYNDFTAQTANIGRGVIQQFSLTLATNVSYNVKIWADFNDNLVFEDSEELYSGASVAAPVTTLLSTFTIPATAPLGSHRLRIAAVSNYVGDATPCDIRSGGTYEDYTINVTVPPTCFTPLNAAGVGIASGNANLSWEAPAQGTASAGYEYAVTTGTTPPATGTPVTATTVTGYALEEDTTYYYLHVRTNCGGGDFSNWVISERFRYLPGELCSTAVSLATLNSPYSFSTENTNNDYHPSCGFGEAPEVFYSIEVPNGYSLNIGLTSTNYDFISSLFYGGCDTDSQTTVGCIDTFGEERFITWENTTGQPQTAYWVQDGYESYFGNFTLQWSLTAPAACDRPRSPETEVTSSVTTNVSWLAPNTGSPEGYEYAVTNSPEPPQSGLYTTALSATNVAVTPNIYSYLHVRSVCGTNGNSIWVSHQFFSGYCIPENQSEESYITGITTAGGETNFANTGTGYSSFTDYTATQSVSTYAGGSFSITATHAGEESLYYVWVDWNNDFEFSESENVISSPFLASPANVGNITVPAGTAQGTYRMRIRNVRNGAGIQPCGEASGETEDYTIVVTPTPTCFPPYALSIEPVDGTTANLRWSPPELGTPPQGYEYVLSSSSVEPTGNGTVSTSIFVESATYNPAQNVYLFVRSICGDGDYSTWATTAILDVDIPQIDKKNVIVYKEASAINITTGTTLITGVTIYDIRGSRLYTQNNINTANVTVTGLQIQQQVLIVEVTTAKGKVSKRIVY